ncbi:MAG: hypothetical protein HZB83_01305, partial [Deltaproteobacteria bacterium]|nr:hypothetical protein [Deltaproteobacteria bacterium]
VSEPTKLSTLYFEIVDLLDCKSWVGEDLKITVRRNMPNEPGRTYKELTDETNIVHDSARVDLNHASRLTRVLVYWDKTAVGKLDDPASYNRLDLALDTDAEGVNEYNDQQEKKFFCRWLRTGYLQEEPLAQFMKDFSLRQVWRQRDAMPIVSLDVELKDSEVKTGEYLKLTTDELLNADGAFLSRALFQAVKRDFKGAKISINLIRVPERKIDFIAPDTAPDWASATEADKEYGYITDDDGKMPDGTPGYFIWG